MALRKIALMHELFGTAPGCCGQCDHLVEGRYHDRMLRKCDVYGLTHSEASDWAKRWAACGLKNKETSHANVIRLVRAEAKEPSGPLDGQVGLEVKMMAEIPDKFDLGDPHRPANRKMNYGGSQDRWLVNFIKRCLRTSTPDLHSFIAEIKNGKVFVNCDCGTVFVDTFVNNAGAEIHDCKRFQTGKCPAPEKLRDLVDFLWELEINIETIEQ